MSENAGNNNRNRSNRNSKGGGYRSSDKKDFRSSRKNGSYDDRGGAPRRDRNGRQFDSKSEDSHKHQGKRYASAGERSGSNGHRWQNGGERKSDDRRSEHRGKRFDNENGGRPSDRRNEHRGKRFDNESNDRRGDRRDDRRDRKFEKRGEYRDRRDDRRPSFGEKRANEPKKNPVRKNKKAFDQQKVATLMDAEAPAYRGELDPKRNERTKIAPGRKTREMRELKEETERQKLNEERKEREAIDDMSVPAEKRFYKNEASPARLAALDVTRAVRKRNAYAHELIASRIDSSNLSQADRAFATLLVLGVVSTSGTLDEVINRAMKKPTDAFDDVRDALRISTYEIIFLDKSPHAALDQGVELVRAISPSAAGLGNAILHRVLEMKPEFPFGDPNHDIEALARVYAFPQWMARKLVEDMGAKEAAVLMHASNDPAPLFVSVNSLKATDEEVIRAFENEGATLRPVESSNGAIAGCYHVSNSRAIAQPSITKLFDEGKILVSDASAQAVAESIFDQAQPESILEIGAGRGTKTILIQSSANRLLGHQIALTSLDLHDFKVELLKKRAADYGVELEDAVAGNATRLENVVGEKTYDTVFVDAPCSGLGTLRRHPEIRWRVKQKHLDELAETQVSILRSAAKHVSPNGQLVYSTCTVTYSENNGVVKRFLESPEGKNFELVPVYGKSCLSSKLTEGSPDAHFAAKFRRVV